MLTLGWLVTAAMLARIGSGGGREIGNVTYAVGGLPSFVAIWGLVTLVAAVTLVGVIVVGRRSGLPSFVAAAFAVPLGVYLDQLGHGSGIPLALLATLIALTSVAQALAEHGTA